LPGMLLHIDASEHRWLNDERKDALIVILDDATSEIYYAQLVEAESTRSILTGLREVIESWGVFCSLYSDRASHFFVTPKGRGMVDKTRLTQVGRALSELGIKMIAAYSPQARGRSERCRSTNDARWHRCAAASRARASSADACGACPASFAALPARPPATPS